MKYERIEKGYFLERPNRFTAEVEIQGKKEIVHVKNTGRCAELLVPGATVYVQRSDNPERKTKWDLICVKKGNRLINMDSQIPNKAVKEWIEAGNLCENPTMLRQEVTYGNSRFDLYAEEEERKIFIEVKGVTLEEDGVVKFPDAPTERGVKHVEELCKAVRDGYEAYIFFVVQMKNVKYFTPNTRTHPEFGEALQKAREQGVHIVAYDCEVKKDEIKIRKEVPVLLEPKELQALADPLVEWFRKHKRALPWREDPSAYRVWVSEIMLQQTRVEAVKPYYERFLSELPDVSALASVEEDRLLKLWEGLGYYNRARNLKAAACQIMEQYGGRFPSSYEEIRSLKGIGNYTAGAIGSFVYHIPKPAVDGNVLRVVSRLTADEGDIKTAAVRSKVEELIEEIIPKDAPGDFNQGLIELGAIVCVPNGEPKCAACPLEALCKAHKEGREMDFPVKKKAKARRIEKRTVFIFRDNEKVAIRKRPQKGLLAGMYEFPNVEGHLRTEEVIGYAQTAGLTPVRVKRIGTAKHIFSHVEWHMTGYELLVDELEKTSAPNVGQMCVENGADGSENIFVKIKQLEEEYAMPSAFDKFVEHTRFS